MRQTDFRTAYAHLGMHPGDMGPQEAQIIFEQAMAAGGGVFVEMAAGPGRTTAILGTAARNVGAKFYVIEAQVVKSPGDGRWFSLAVLLHQLSLTHVEPSAVKEVLNGGGVDLILVNGEQDISKLPLKDGCVIILRKSNETSVPAECVVDHRPTISVWRKSATPAVERTLSVVK